MDAGARVFREPPLPAFREEAAQGEAEGVLADTQESAATEAHIIRRLGPAVDGFVQTVAAGAKLPGDARPGWKVLRALGAALGLQGFAFTEFSEVRAAVADALATKSSAAASAAMAPSTTASVGAGAFERISTVPIYRSDAILRRSPALQAHPLTGVCSVGLHPEDALALGLGNGGKAKVSAGAATVELPVVVTRAVPRGGAWIEKTWKQTRALPGNGGALTITRA